MSVRKVSASENLSHRRIRKLICLRKPNIKTTTQMINKEAILGFSVHELTMKAN